jgi:hypothetical protein
MTQEEKELLFIDLCNRIPYIPASDRIVWLNAHHFDYSGLIPKGLALEAPEDMYEINEK